MLCFYVNGESIADMKQLNKYLVRVVCYKYESIRDILDVNLMTEKGSKVNRTCQDDVMDDVVEYILIVNGKALCKSDNKAKLLSMARHLQLRHHKTDVYERITTLGKKVA